MAARARLAATYHVAVEGPAMRAIFDAVKRADLHRLCLPRELGGLNAPLMTFFLGGEMVARFGGDVSALVPPQVAKRLTEAFANTTPDGSGM